MAELVNAAPVKPRPVPRDEIGWLLVAVSAALSIALVDARTAMTIVAAISIFVGSLIFPAAGVSVLVATVPVQDAWPAHLGDQTATWTRIALIAFTAAWVVRLCLGKERIRLTPVARALAAYCGALVLSIVHARDLGAWSAETYRWLVALAVFMFATSCVKTSGDRQIVLAGLGAGVLLCFALAIDQVLSGSGPQSFEQRGLIRAYGLFGEPNPLAGYLEMATLPLLAAGISRIRGHAGKHRIAFGVFALIVALVAAATLLMTQSRGGLLGFAVGAAVIVWFTWPVSGKRLVLAGALASAILIWTPPAERVRVAFGLDSPLTRDAVQVTSDNWAAQERLAHWGAAIKMWLSEPMIGIGAGNYAERFREMTPEWRFRIPRGHAHSAYLQAAAQAGAAGLACFLAVLASAWWAGLRSLRAGLQESPRAAAMAALAVTAAVAVHGMFDYLHVLSLSIVLSVVWAMASGEEVDWVDTPVNHGGN